MLCEPHLVPYLQLKSTEINTRGFEALLNLVNNTANDSFELYYGLFLYNQNATDELERLEQVGVLWALEA
jgi:arogenate dehydrogenase (NADP+)